MNDTNILRELESTPWAILPAALQPMIERARLYAAGEYDLLRKGSMSEPIEAAQRSAAPPSRSGAVAVLPIRGVIRQRGGGGFIEEMIFGGGTSIEAFSAVFRRMMADEGVKAVVIDIDSPGGGVYGVQELADEIYKARGPKPIVAVANSLAASAAYWIASAADQVYVMPSGEVGSIGVFAIHIDYSEADKARGINATIISAGKYKVEGNEWEPLTEEGREAIQGRVNDYYDAFVKGVARNRGAPVSAVRNGYGEGRVLGAKAALAEGMVDRIGTLGEALAKVGGSLAPVATASSQGNDIDPEIDSGAGDLDRRRRRLRLAERG